MKVKDRSLQGGKTISGYGLGDVDTVFSVDEVAREADKLAVEGPGVGELDALVRGEVMVAVDDLVAGYSKMEILHGVSLRVGAGQSLCLIRPNGAGQSTVLHSIYGFARILSGKIVANGRDVTRLPPNEKLRAAGIAYIPPGNSVFPHMTV